MWEFGIKITINFGHRTKSFSGHEGNRKKYRQINHCFRLLLYDIVFLRINSGCVSLSHFLRRISPPPPQTIQEICHTRQSWQLRVGEKVYSTRYAQAVIHGPIYWVQVFRSIVTINSHLFLAVFRALINLPNWSHMTLTGTSSNTSLAVLLALPDQLHGIGHCQSTCNRWQDSSIHVPQKDSCP